MEAHTFHNIQEATDKLINIKSIEITKLVSIRLETQNPGVISNKKSFSEQEEWFELT